MWITRNKTARLASVKTRLRFTRPNVIRLERAFEILRSRQPTTLSTVAQGG